MLTITMKEKNEKLTLRISDDELEEIDNFLSTNVNFTNRSEFIRFATMEYITNQRIGIITKNNSVHTEPIIEKTLSKAVNSGYFKSLESAYEEIINEAWRKNLISLLINMRIKEMEKIQKTMGNEVKYDKI